MKHDILLIGTYHKTGTVWMERVFTIMAPKFGLPFVGNHLGLDPCPAKPGFYLDEHSCFPETLLKADHIGFRMIRDPRDIIISGAHYHAISDESWLHKPKEALGGRTYQQAILDESDQLAQYLFELQNVALETTRQMIEGYIMLPHFETVRYENWMNDTSLMDFSRVMGKLGLTASETETARQVFYDYSLFGERQGIDQHTRSGKVAQWRDTYTRPLGEKFIEIYGDALVTLGYEKNHDWVLGLPED